MSISTDKNRIREVLSRGVEEVIVKKEIEKKLFSGKKLRIKLGIDPTGPKMHLGRAVILRKLRAFQELGHQVVLIIGDFTGLIGDASDKPEKRNNLTEKEIKENFKSYEKQVGLILDMRKVELRRNSEWLGKMTWREGLELSKKFTAQRLIQRRNFKERWDKGKPIGLHELSYPLLQGSDSVAIKADIELGGLDQLFNLKAGRDIQRIKGQKPQDIMTLKMLDGLDGRKMSTSWGNVINITDEPNNIYGKIMSMKDELIGQYFELCTDLEVEEREIKSKPRDMKAKLAKEIVRIYHNDKKAEQAEQEFDKIFKNKEMPDEMPKFKISDKPQKVVDIIVGAGLAKSKGEAKRLIQGGGVGIISNGEEKIVKDGLEQVELKNRDVIRVGKRHFVEIIVKLLNR